MQKNYLTTALTMMSVPMLAASLPDVTGTIVDPHGMPMEFVNVVLLNPVDSAFVQGATTDHDGRFTIATPETSGILKPQVSVRCDTIVRCLS